MPTTKPTSSSWARKTNPRQTVKVIIHRASRKNFPGRSLDAKPAASKSLPNYPWDSHQDDIVVNSVEIPTKQRTGVKHYLHQLALQEDYKKICIDFNEYRCRGSTKSGWPDIDDEVHDEIDAEQHIDYGRVDFSAAPKPAPSTAAYEYQIYTCTTTNPAVFLAITRIAQRNLPFIDFQSALNHLPNLHPTKQLPKLRSGCSAEDITHEARIGTDHHMTVLFFPFFYHDGRDAVGYYAPSAPSRGYMSNRRHPYVQEQNQMLFTPCIQKELEIYGLITYANQSKTQRIVKADDELDPLPLIQSVGAKGGRWIGANIAEEWEEYREAFNIVANVWQQQLEATRLKDLL